MTVRKRIRTLTFVLVASASVAGCTQVRSVPTPVDQPPSTQERLQAGKHWAAVASHVASQLHDPRRRLPEPRLIYVSEAPHDTPFDTTFREMLRGELLRRGYAVATERQHAPLVLEVSTQVIVHHDRDVRRLVPGQFLVMAGLSFLGLNAVNWSHPEILAVPAAGALDLAAWYDPIATQWSVPNHELVVTTAISAADRYLFSNTDVYYINDPDVSHYEWVPAPATPSRRIRLVSE